MATSVKVEGRKSMLEEIDEYMSHTFSAGEPIDEEDIDRILYDEERL